MFWLCHLSFFTTQSLRGFLGGCPIRLQMIALACALSEGHDVVDLCHALASISLDAMRINEVGATRLATALRSNRTVTALDLGNNLIGKDWNSGGYDMFGVNSIGNVGVAALADTMTVNTTITKIKLEGVSTTVATDVASLRRLEFAAKVCIFAHFRENVVAHFSSLKTRDLLLTAQ